MRAPGGNTGRGGQTYFVLVLAGQFEHTWKKLKQKGTKNKKWLLVGLRIWKRSHNSTDKQKINPTKNISTPITLEEEHVNCLAKMRSGIVCKGNHIVINKAQLTYLQGTLPFLTGVCFQTEIRSPMSNPSTCTQVATTTVVKRPSLVQS